MAAFRRPKNLRDSLVHSSASRRDTVGSGPCNISRCMTCTSITSSTTFTSTITRKSYNILHSLSCHSLNVIYLITCNLCSKQCVGLTSQTLRKRFNTHRFNTNNDRGDAVAKHFNLPGHTISHAKITPIDQLLTADMIGLQNKETFWIHSLQTLEPQDTLRIAGPPTPHRRSTQVAGTSEQVVLLTQPTTKLPCQLPSTKVMHTSVHPGVLWEEPHQTQSINDDRRVPS
ncbi:hypothetical protein RRG08_050725 [Elysia crispata]|uniref:GIY-YIG domain-containing protein n=1 Tax=Elysia crispata TaxID=231223 RepID=A0AAE1BBT2_9GAST|nr:hypothetical protein RRG08_050725 [Elysia crispata]